MLALSGVMPCCGWKVCQNFREVVISMIRVMFIVEPVWMTQKWKKEVENIFPDNHKRVN
jgi:hypothetical protein